MGKPEVPALDASFGPSVVAAAALPVAKNVIDTALAAPPPDDAEAIALALLMLDGAPAGPSEEEQLAAALLSLDAVTLH